MPNSAKPLHNVFIKNCYIKDHDECKHLTLTPSEEKI